MPFSPRPFALPLLFRLYRSKKECAAHGGDYHTKTEQARELVERLLAWLPTASFDLLLDSGYTNRVVLRGLPSRVRVLGALTIRAALTTAGGRTLRNGRHSPKGAPRASLAAWAEDASHPWETIEAQVYGGLRTMQIKTAEVQWWSVLGAPPIRVVLLRCTTGSLSLRAFLCTDPDADAASILIGYARRWSMEVYFFEVKQFLGLCASRARLEWAVRRVAPCVGLLYGVLVVWFWEQSERGLEAVVPNRPWYGHKDAVSFEDILRTARAALGREPLIAQVEALAPLCRAYRRAAAPLGAMRHAA